MRFQRGMGGFGIVYMAEQDKPVHRRVAIKIVPHAAVNPEFAARFDFERRALERTEHPNIARILDAGQRADGLPYLGRSRKIPNLVIATGHAMMGLSLGPVTGKLVGELLDNAPASIDLSLLAPERYG